MENVTSTISQDDTGECFLANADVNVKVCPILDSEVGMIFALGGKVASGVNGSVKGHVIRLEEEDRRLEISFKLKNSNGTNLRFHPEEPIWITDDEDCPEASSWVQGWEITKLNDTELRIVNPGEEGVYTYTLRFLRGTAVVICDPIIKNIA
jgi:hypothetical protein